MQGTGLRRQLLVVTRETDSGGGIPQYRIYTGVAVSSRQLGWRMAKWQREP